MRTRLKFLLHFHSDPNWRVTGAIRYDECKCGARRVRQAYTGMHGVREPGWPSMTDSHGVYRGDSGWKMPDEY